MSLKIDVSATICVVSHAEKQNDKIIFLFRKIKTLLTLKIQKNVDNTDK